MVISVTVDVRRDRFDAVRSAIRQATAPASREAAREFVKAMQDRRDSGDVPGPPVHPFTRAKEAAVLRELGLPVERAGLKWHFLGTLIDDMTFHTTRMMSGAKTEAFGPDHPENRTREVFETLEKGGWVVDSALGEIKVFYVPPRPLIGVVAAQDRARWVLAAVEVLKRHIRGAFEGG